MIKGFKGVKGFKFAARSSAIKKSGKPDLALIFSEVPARCAGVFTTNQVKAAPLVISAPRVKNGRCQAVLINSGNANACTGESGLRNALRSAEVTGRVLGIMEDLVVVSSTGIIGEQLPMEKLERHIPLLPESLNSKHPEAVAEAILTTDSFTKVSHRTHSGENGYTILGIAKGAGMIHPDMATMLAFVLTDAKVERGFLNEALTAAVKNSFNCISVDGDTSTNDMALLLANGLAGDLEIKKGTTIGKNFGRQLAEVCLDLAKMIVKDGEGATKLVRIQVSGAGDDRDAREVARSVATSSLVKTAFFGEDPNWGRILSAIGYSKAKIDPGRIDIYFNDTPVILQGLAVGKEDLAKAAGVMKMPEFSVNIKLHAGTGEAFYYTSDLTYEYVKINAEYHT
jgi:glutamate N-acetyltransferase/amino-acid N-acetyltransferase